MIKANKLKVGDTVAIIAPSSPASKKQIALVEGNMKKLGLKYKMLPSCFESHGHFAGTDAVRAKDVHDAFSNTDYKGVICLKGGYGTPRILPLIDYDLIKNNPKVFLGYSDVTGLHLAINTQCDLVTFHGPMATTSLDETYSVDFLKKTLMSDQAVGKFINPHHQPLVSLFDGYCEGQIIGGNLSLLVSTLGSPYEINTKGKILFIEEVAEANYRVDRMLTSLMLAGKFKDCVGILLGTFTKCEPEMSKGKKIDLDLNTIFEEIILPFKKPTLMNLRAGHNSPQATIPFGSHVILDSKTLSIIFQESGVI